MDKDYIEVRVRIHKIVIPETYELLKNTPERYRKEVLKKILIEHNHSQSRLLQLTPIQKIESNGEPIQQLLPQEKDVQNNVGPNNKPREPNSKSDADFIPEKVEPLDKGMADEYL